MRPIISTSSTSITTQQRRPSIPSNTSAVESSIISTEKFEVLEPRSPETNGQSLSNGNTIQPSSETNSSPLTLSSSTSSMLSKKLETTAGVPLTKKPPPVAKKISLLSDSISKFEQNSDGARPKVSWKSFIKPSISSHKLAINDTGNNKCNEGTNGGANAKIEVLDENNNELKTELNFLSATVENSSTSLEPMTTTDPKAILDEKSKASIITTNINTEREKLAPQSRSSDQTNNDQLSDNQSVDNQLCATDLEIKSSDTTTPPVKVKKIVKKIIKRTVTKSSSDLTSLGEPSEDKVVRIVKKKVIKTKKENSDETTEKAVTNETPTQITTQSNALTLHSEDKTTLNDPAIQATNKQQLADTTGKIESLSSKNDSVSSTSKTLSEKLQSTNLNNLPLKSADIQHSESTDIDAAFKLPPVVPLIQLSSKTSPQLKERRRSWGKLEKLPISVALSRDSTLDDLSREPSILSGLSSPYSLTTTRSSSVLSNYESWQSSRSETPKRMHTSSHTSIDNDYFQPTSYLRLDRPPVRLSVHSLPSKPEKNTNDYLSEKIEHFLKRTDHVMRDYKQLDRCDKKTNCTDDLRGTYRSKSVSNIIARGLTLLKDEPLQSRSSSRMSSINRDIFLDCSEDDSRTVVDDAELSEMTAELSEEHSSSNLISERLEAETTERLRLEKEVKEHETKYRNLQESSEKLEMELLCAKSDLNGDLDDDLEGDESGGSAYRIKYERVARELEFTKKRLQTQHEHDLEQLIGLKKQLEKKLADAYEEVEEQRQVVGQWKRKAQKMTNEMNDLRMLLEEQNSRNNLLEKRQRKFDSECQALQDSARQEKQAKERLTREKEVLIAEKFTIEQSLSDVRLELELKEEKYSALQRELEEMTFGGGTEEEIAQLKRQKMELDRRCKEQEEELDEMAGQIQLLEQAKLRLEMSLETMRKDARKEAQQRDDELEEVRGSSYKKIKSLECQLEQEHEERTLLLREKHELERRLNNLEDQDRADRAAEEHASQKLKRDLRKYKALLRDAQNQLERVKTDSAGKTLIRQLRNQLEDAESARSAAMKARQVAENELQDVQSMLEEAQRARFDAEDKATSAQRDRTELQAQIDENDEEMAELMKKYSTTVKQLSSEQAVSADYELKISELESEKKSLKEQISDLTSRLENVENISDSSSSIQFKRLELRTKELESRLEFEQATRARMEIQLNRHKDSLEKAQSEISQTRNKEIHAQEALKKAQKTIRELREELHSITNKEHESVIKRKDLEKRLESVEAEAASARADLRLALQRIADLQQAMEEGDSYHSDSENSDSSIDSMSELNFRSMSNVSSVRGRTGDVNGTSTNGGSTTLCIREEKENTPRIRSKFKGSCLRRRGLPFTIKEEEEEEEFSLDSTDQQTERKKQGTIEDDDAAIDNCIESIRKAISDDATTECVHQSKNDQIDIAPPKHTGTIKKTFKIPATSYETTFVGKPELEIYIPNNRTEFNHDINDSLSDRNKQSTSESLTVTEKTKSSTSMGDRSDVDSRFDLEALKSIKEKIRSLNRNLKEEAVQETCSKNDFTQFTVEPTSKQPEELPEKEASQTHISSFKKLDQIDSQLNVDGIRLMKEKIRSLKKKLQEESPSSVARSLSQEEIIGEINEMKKTLTAAFINNKADKDALRRSSSQKEDRLVTEHNSSTTDLAFESFAPSSSDSSLSSLKISSAAVSENINGRPMTTVLHQGVVNEACLSGSTAENNVLPDCLPKCTNSIELAGVLMKIEYSPGDTFQKTHTAINIEKVEDKQSNIPNSLGMIVPITSNMPESNESCEIQEPMKEKNIDEIVSDGQYNVNDRDTETMCGRTENVVENDIALQTVNAEIKDAYIGVECNLEVTREDKCKTVESLQNTSQILEEQPENFIGVFLEQQKSDSLHFPVETESAIEKQRPLNETSLSATSEEVIQVCNDINIQSDSESSTCLKNGCENKAMCRCENIDQIVTMLTNSMEQMEKPKRCLQGLQNQFGNNNDNNSDDSKMQSQTNVPDITAVENFNQSCTDNSCSAAKSDSEKLPINIDGSDFDHAPLCVDTSEDISLTTANKENAEQIVENIYALDAKSLTSMPNENGSIQSTFETDENNQDQQVVSNLLLEANTPKEEKPLLEVDNNNNETDLLKGMTTEEQRHSPNGNKANISNRGSLKRKSKLQVNSSDSSATSSRRSSLTDSLSRKTVYSDLAKGNTVKTVQASSQVQSSKITESSLNVTKSIDNIMDQVSERTSLVNRTDLFTSSSCSIVPTYAVAVSIDVTNSNVTQTMGGAQNASQQQKPLTYAESLRKARTPPKTQGAPVRVPSTGMIAPKINATRNGKQQQQQQQNPQQRVRHLSLARGGNSTKQISDTIRQSKSASRLSSKHPDVKPSILSNVSKNPSMNRNIPQGTRNLNKSSSNILQDNEILNANTGKSTTKLSKEQINNVNQKTRTTTRK